MAVNQINTSAVKEIKARQTHLIINIRGGEGSNWARVHPSYFVASGIPGTLRSATGTFRGKGWKKKTGKGRKDEIFFALARTLQAQGGNLQADEGCFAVLSFYFRPATAQLSDWTLQSPSTALVKCIGLLSTLVPHHCDDARRISVSFASPSAELAVKAQTRQVRSNLANNLAAPQIAENILLIRSVSHLCFFL